MTDETKSVWADLSEKSGAVLQWFIDHPKITAFTGGLLVATVLFMVF